MKIDDIVKETKAFYCLECGVCTGSCPVSRVLPSFSPRMMVTEALLGLEGEIFKDSNPWQCLTCGRCSHRCPSKVDYQGFIRSLRVEAVGKGLEGVVCFCGPTGRLPRPGCYPTLCSVERGLSSTLQMQDRDNPSNLRRLYNTRVRRMRQHGNMYKGGHFEKRH